MIIRALLLGLVAAAGLAFGPRTSNAATSEAASATPFQAGDTVCWVGDSITHGGSYHEIVELFYATRFPDRAISYYNDGIGGDRASAIMSDVNFRLNVDILAHKPSVATIMLGMNDVNRGDYGPDKTGPEIEQRHQMFLDLYEENMKKLMDALVKSGAKLILIKPSIYDETTQLPKVNPANAIGSNGALGKCSEKIDVWAKEYHAGIVDFYDAMNQINLREQKKDPAFTLVGADRIHPGPVGHFVMGYVFLKAQGMPQEVATIVVNAKKGAADGSSNAAVTHVAKIAGGVEFDALEKALPFVAPEAAKPALALIPFDEELNRETLRISGLPKGTYGVKIDGEEDGEYTAEQLKAGVNLAINAMTPQYKQAAAAALISVNRTKVGATLRDIAAVKYGLSKAKVDVSDNADVEKRMREQIADAKSANKPVNRSWQAVLDDLADPGRLAQQYDSLSGDLLKACQPAAHHYSVVRK